MHPSNDVNPIHASGSAPRRAASMEPQVADRLPDLLASDDAFRRLFKRNPHAALEQIGFRAPPGLLSPAGCFFGIESLASKATIAAARLEIRGALMSGLGQHPIQLDTGNRALRRR